MCPHSGRGKRRAMGMTDVTVKKNPVSGDRTGGHWPPTGTGHCIMAARCAA